MLLYMVGSPCDESEVSWHRIMGFVLAVDLETRMEFLQSVCEEFKPPRLL